MARVVINPIKIKDHSVLSDSVKFDALTTAIDVTSGAEIKLDGHDERTVILIYNSATSEGTATIKAGNGLQGVRDEVCTIPASSVAFIVPESGRFKNVSGDDRGKLIITGAATIKVACIMLP